MSIIVPDDLSPFAEIVEIKAQAMIDDAMADASRVAPCIIEEDLTPAKVAQFRSILRGAILRWNESGTGALQQQQVGPFGQTIDTRQQRKGMFWPSELAALASVCSETSDRRGAYEMDTMPAGAMPGRYSAFPEPPLEWPV